MDKRLLFTPGPLTTSRRVRAAMNRDWGSRDPSFVTLTTRVRTVLTNLVTGEGTHETVLLQGSGTYAVEAAIASLVGPDEPLLILINGAYGHRISKIAARLGKLVHNLEFEEKKPISPQQVADYLSAHKQIKKIALVQLETTTGVINPTTEIAAIADRAGCDLLLDAMSGFGCYPIDVRALPCAAVIASSNKVLHGPPGIGFVIADRNLLERSKGNCASLSLDLYDQWKEFERSGEWRFTPPTHCLAALEEALKDFLRSGGLQQRRRQYDANAKLVLERLVGLGFECIIEPDHRSSVILTFGFPPGEWFSFRRLYDEMATQGYFLYPGKLTGEPSFRVGCIGALQRSDFEEMLEAFERSVRGMRPEGAIPAARFD